MRRSDRLAHLFLVADIELLMHTCLWARHA